MTPDPTHREWLQEIVESQARQERHRDRQAMRSVYWRRRAIALAVIALVAFVAGLLVATLL